MQPSDDSAPSAFERPLLRVALASALLAVLALAALLVWMRRDDSSPDGELISIGLAPTPAVTAAREEGVGALDSRAPLIGQPAPDFALRDAAGTLIRLSDLRGSIVFVNFWASWCRPCKKELPDIQRIYDEKVEAGLVVLAINQQDSPATAAAYWNDGGFTMPMLLDRHGDVFEQYRLRGLPDSFFIDRDGRIAGLQFGALSEQRMRQKLADAGLP